MFSEIISLDNLEQAYRNTQIGDSKFKPAAIYFNRDRYELLDELREELYLGTYTPGKYIEFTVLEPKERLIFAPQYRDKIVQHAINNLLAEHCKRYFIHDSYACITEKGNRRAVLKIRDNLNNGLLEYGETAYVIKADIVKFFASIDRTILKCLLRKIIKCSLLLKLLDLIIDTAPELNGLPLGNLTSQLLANVYMNVLDHFCKRILKCKYYVRYADDFFIVCKDHVTASEVLSEIREYCLDELQLHLHNTKSYIQPIDKPLSALGFMLHPRRIELQRVSKTKINRRIKFYCNSYVEDTRVVLENRLNGWLNHANLASITNYLNHLIVKYPNLECDGKQFSLV